MTQEITNIHRAHALALAEKGTAKDHRIRDSLVRGLCLRVRGKRATWALMTRSQSINLGDADDMSVKDARERARDILNERRPVLRKAVATLTKAGINPIDAGLLARGVPIDPTDRYVEHWTWQQGMDAFLEVKLPKLAPRWATQFKKYARDDVFFPLEYRAISTIKYPQLDLIRAEIRKTYTEAKAHAVMSAGLQMMNYIWKEHRTQAGLADLHAPWWTELGIDRPPSGQRHVPTTDEVVMTLAVLRDNNKICRRKLAALTFCVLSVQRIQQVCKTERDQIDIHSDGSGIVHWRGNQTKNRKPQALWLPKDTIDLVATEGRWAFPSSATGLHHVKPSVITRWLADLWRPPAKPSLTRLLQRRRGPPPGTGRNPSILRDAGLPHWTPHGVRTTCSTELIEAQMDGASSAILGHTPKNLLLPERPIETRAEAVTLRYYNRAQRIPLKRAGIEKWHAILREAEQRLAGL
jgi:integrase